MGRGPSQFCETPAKITNQVKADPLYGCVTFMKSLWLEAGILTCSCIEIVPKPADWSAGVSGSRGVQVRQTRSPPQGLATPSLECVAPKRLNHPKAVTNWLAGV